MEVEAPIRIIPKIVKWGIKRGYEKKFSNGKSELIIQAYQKGCGQSNSGAVGRRRSRFYQGRFMAKSGKITMATTRIKK